MKFAFAMLTMVAMAVCVASCDKDKDDEKGGGSGGADIKYAWKLVKSKSYYSNNWYDPTVPHEDEDCNCVRTEWKYLVITTDNKCYDIWCTYFEGGDFDTETRVYENATIGDLGIKCSGKSYEIDLYFDTNKFGNDDFKNISFILSQPTEYEGTDSKEFEDFNLTSKEIVDEYSVWERIK